MSKAIQNKVPQMWINRWSRHAINGDTVTKFYDRNNNDEVRKIIASVKGLPKSP
jgi:hypothetical protein